MLGCSKKSTINSTFNSSILFKILQNAHHTLSLKSSTILLLLIKSFYLFIFISSVYFFRKRIDDKHLN